MKRLLFVLLFLFSANSFAANYYWYAKGTNGQAQYPTPRAACDAQLVGWKKQYSQGFEQWIVQDSDTQWRCRFKSSPSGSNFQEWTWLRAGDSCTSPQVWDTTTGGCITPAGEDGDLCGGTTWDSATPFVWSSGQCVRAYGSPVICKAFSKRDGGIAASTKVTLNTAVKGPINGQTVAQDGIACSIKVTSSTCTINADGQSTVCLVNGTYTGEKGGGTDAPEAQDCRALGGCLPVDLTPKTDTNNKPCNYTTGSDGSLSCTSKQETKTSGSQNCGTANGTFSCEWNSPTSKGIDITTGITTTTNPDGSTTAVKTDVSSKTVCTDMNVCSTVTTTTKTTTTKDGNGTLISSSSTCSGAACGTGSASNGTGTGGGSGNGSGEGGGDCVTAEECGDGSSPDTPKLDKVDDYQQTTQKFYDKVKASPIATSVGAIAVPNNGAPPNFNTGSIAFLGGVSLDFGIIAQLWAGVADVLHLVMKAVWCFVAVFIFLMA